MFARNNRELGKNPWVKVKVDTGDAVPVYMLPYCMGKAEWEAADTEISKITDAGHQEAVIKKQSSRSFLMTSIKKQSGGLRCVVDLCRLNQVLKLQPYLMGNIQDILDSVAPPVGQKRYYYSFDMVSGFFSLELADQESMQRPIFFTTLLRKILAPMLLDGGPTLPGATADEDALMTPPLKCATPDQRCVEHERCQQKSRQVPPRAHSMSRSIRVDKDIVYLIKLTCSSAASDRASAASALAFSASARRPSS
ncbi:hypothetical protein VOLCADRAFT_98705 [Volvox carteri f. nagariensis]|uniref:Reverse transcriptase domain-containing protein n=1 Tax=Volvox carteri f. nagariensis TaxID=3068 RepID=D8UG24_VOLCA|nr:uncharacterized protein VOLCADRAFT_98705 [Volvox carteri f. nagariensis]EFJ41275.1 hypothetical protein VOLCADRAFT_98705 [Volvox carteri f. nagariensis]|eukprot:XP_002957609.1 hypothetical protein VOLCADRAFT_98705 [Volvox carteri f. nagariensis]